MWILVFIFVNMKMVVFSMLGSMRGSVMCSIVWSWFVFSICEVFLRVVDVDFI